jgi:hypothetical protein
VYYSYLLKITDTTGSNTTTGGFGVSLNNTGDAATTTNPTTSTGKLQIRQHTGATSTQYDVEVVNNRNAATADTNWTGPFNVGDTQFVVIAYSLTSHTSSLWMNPDPSTFGAASAPTATETDSTADSVATIASILLRQSPAPSMTVDEIRLGTSWADVTTVPEPASLGLLCVAGSALMARRRR